MFSAFIFKTKTRIITQINQSVDGKHNISKIINPLCVGVKSLNKT